MSQLRRRRMVLGAAVLVVSIVVSSIDAGAWVQVGHEQIASLTQGQGLATVRRADGSTYLFYDGTLSVPPEKTAAGWDHVGDPDSSQGHIFQPYQAADPATAAKLFAVTRPDGTEVDFVHHDIAGEQYNNSFVAVSPDGAWMVSGEWGAMTRLLVMPTPLLNPAATDPAADLPIVGRIQLDRTVTDVQGCTFVTDVRLVCSSDDPIDENGFLRKSMVQVDLPHALDGSDTTGHATQLLQVPLQSTCPVTAPGSWPDDFEVEGIDYDRWAHQLRVIVIPPALCGVTGDVYVYDEQGLPVTTTTATSSPPPSTASTGPVAVVAATPRFTG